jgi:prefoldin subunit 5
MSPDQEQLYVKLDNKQHLQEDLEDIDQLVANIREAADILKRVNSIKQESINKVNQNLDRLNAKMTDLDQKLPEVQDGEVSKPPKAEVHSDVSLDDSVSQLNDELQNLQSELSGLDN